MFRFILAAALAIGGDPGRIAVQHEGRVKPLDTFARQMMQFLTEKESFRSFTDPATGQRVEVFLTSDPVSNILALIDNPQEARSRRFIKITHPKLKADFGLDAARSFFSLEDLEPARSRLMQAAAGIDEDSATSQDRAVLKVVHQFMTVEALYQQRLLAIVPVPFGEKRSWMTPHDVRSWLSGGAAHDGRSGEITGALEEFVKTDPSRRSALAEVLDLWDARRFDDLGNRLRALNPGVYPLERRLEVEILYNEVRPFHWASGVYFLAALAFLMALIGDSRRLWWTGLGLHAAGLGLTGYGYALRWIIAGRYPLSNHYESMIMCALGAALLAAVLELTLRSKALVGLGGAIVASLLLVLANNVPTFAEQGFVAPLVPALQTVWMTIHVPVIMTGYAMGMLLMVLGHVYLIRQLINRLSIETEKILDSIMYRVLQLTALFLLIGVILGAVWAGEAWGRPWGWDMKETWALITLLSYIATLHGRFLGALRGFGTAIASLVAFQVLILTYYGVNFLFGKGLHTYGFGAGESWPLVGFFLLEFAFAVCCFIVRGNRPVSPESPSSSGPGVSTDGAATLQD